MYLHDTKIAKTEVKNESINDESPKGLSRHENIYTFPSSLASWPHGLRPPIAIPTALAACRLLSQTHISTPN